MIRRLVTLFLLIVLVAGCSNDGCKGPKGDVGPSGPTGTPGPQGPGTYTKTAIWSDDLSNYSSLANWANYLIGGGGSSFTLTRTATTFTSPSFGGAIDATLVNSSSCYYRQIIGASGTLCAKINVYGLGAIGTPLNTLEFALANGGNMVALVGYDPNQSTKIYLNNAGSNYQVAGLPNSWSTIEMCVNLSTGKSDYLLNGAVIGSGYQTSVPASFSGQPSTWFGVYARTNGSWSFNFDDVEVFLKS